MLTGNTKPQYTEGTEISVSCPGSSSTFIERLLYSRYCVWDTQQIRQGLLSHSSGLMNSPQAANETAGLHPAISIVWFLQCLRFPFYNKLPTSGFSETGNFCWIPAYCRSRPCPWPRPSRGDFSSHLFLLSPRQLWPNSPTSITHLTPLKPTNIQTR